MLDFHIFVEGHSFWHNVKIISEESGFEITVEIPRQLFSFLYIVITNT